MLRKKVRGVMLGWAVRHDGAGPAGPRQSPDVHTTTNRWSVDISLAGGPKRNNAGHGTACTLPDGRSRYSLKVTVQPACFQMECHGTACRSQYSLKVTVQPARVKCEMKLM